MVAIAPTMTDPEELLTPREVARELRVDHTTVIRWIKGGLLSAIFLPTRGKKQNYRIRRRTLIALTTERRVEG